MASKEYHKPLGGIVMIAYPATNIVPTSIMGTQLTRGQSDHAGAKPNGCHGSHENNRILDSIGTILKSDGHSGMTADL